VVVQAWTQTDAAQDGQSTTSGEREEACELIAMQSDQMLRAKVRDLMVSGLLPRVQSDGSLVNEAGQSVPGQRQLVARFRLHRKIGDPNE